MTASKSVLVFGAGGFVGGYLAREFKEHGYEVFGSDLQGKCENPYFDAARAADITDAEGVGRVCREFEPAIIVNLAAISSVGFSWKNPQATMSVNVIGSLNILDAARAMADSPKILFVGSSEEYAPSDIPLKETDPIDATNPYGISKMVQERMAKAYEQRYGLSIYRTRSFNHTGVGQPDTFVLPSWCKQVAEIERSGKPGVIRVGNIGVSRDFSDVRDVVHAYRLLVESDYAGEPFNIGSGVSVPLKEILNTVTSFCAQPVEVVVDPVLLRPSDNPVICADCGKAERLLGWRTEHSLGLCLEQMYSDFLKNGKNVRC